MLILRKFLRDVPAVLGLLIILAVCLIAILSPLIVPNLDMVYDGDLISRLRSPSAEFWCGTDSLGRDVFARMIMGTRGALAVALTVVALAIAIGVPAGLYAGYADGWGSEIVMRVTDVFLAVPPRTARRADAEPPRKRCDRRTASRSAPAPPWRSPILAPSVARQRVQE